MKKIFDNRYRMRRDFLQAGLRAGRKYYGQLRWGPVFLRLLSATARRSTGEPKNLRIHRMVLILRFQFEKQVGPDEIEVVFEYDWFGNMVCRREDPDRETYEGLNSKDAALRR